MAQEMGHNLHQIWVKRPTVENGKETELMIEREVGYKSVECHQVQVWSLIPPPVFTTFKALGYRTPKERQ